MKKIKALLAILLSILLICAAPTSVIADELSHEDTIALERIEPVPAKEEAPAPNNSEKDDPSAGDPEDDELLDESESSQSPISLPETGNALPDALPGVPETPQLASRASLMAALASDFVDVQTITDLPTDAIIGIPLTLSGTVFPENATNKAISWEVASANNTGAKITGDTLTTTAAGQVTVRAKIVNGKKGGTENFTKAFSILVSETGSSPTIVPVDSIDGLTTQAIVGIPLTLSGTVMPANATNKTIVWSVDYANSTGAIIENDVFTATAPGVATIHYTIKDGSAVGIDFDGAFGLVVSDAPAFVSVTSITDVPTTATVGTPLTLSGTVAPSNATNQSITWSVKDAGATGASIADGKLSATAPGTVTVTATIVHGASETTHFTKDFTITVNAAPAAAKHTISLSVKFPDNTFEDLTPAFIEVEDGINLYTALANIDLSAYAATYDIYTWYNRVNIARFADSTLVTSDLSAYAFLIEKSAPKFLPVTSITNVPTKMTVDTPLTLTGTVAPTDATNQTITWSVKDAGETGATIANGALSATAAGTVTVTATIVNGASDTADYTQDFTITVNAPAPTDPATHVNVELTVEPNTTTVQEGTKLSFTVVPNNGNGDRISGGVINLIDKSDGNKLLGTSVSVFIGKNTFTDIELSTGTHVIEASFEKAGYTSTPATLTITVTGKYEPVTAITDVPTTATVGTPLTLSGTVAPSNATNQTITWSVKDAGTTGASIANGVLSATAAGTATVTATIVNGASDTADYTQDFTITVTAEPVKTHRVFLYVQKPNELPFAGLNSQPLVVNDGEKLYTALADVDFSLYSADYTIETWFNYSTGAKFDSNTVVTEDMYAFAKLTPAIKYTICYRDGLDNAVFDMQSHTVQANNATPAFVGTPTRAGYTFAGWDPEVAPTVTADATYTAKWKAIAADDNDDNSGDKDDNSDDDDVPKTGDRRAAAQQATLLLSLACFAISLVSGYKYKMSARK